VTGALDDVRLRLEQLDVCVSEVRVRIDTARHLEPFDHHLALNLLGSVGRRTSMRVL
jgi:hypothetical protein